MYKKKFALVGFGYWGKIHYKYLRKYNLKKIFIRNKKNQNISNNLKKILTNKINEITNNKNIQYVDIVTPIETHYKLSLRYLRAGKKVLVEKPLLMNSKEKMKIKKYSENLCVSYPYLFSDSINKAVKIINSKKLGKIKFIEIKLNQLGRFSKFSVYELLGVHGICIISKFFNLNNIKFKHKKVIKNNKKTESAIIECYINKKLVSIINLSLNNLFGKKEKKFNIFLEKGNIFCDLAKNKNNFEIFEYDRIKNKNKYFEKIFIKKKSIFSFNENNNIDKVIKNFVSSEYSFKENFKITSKINNFLKNV